MQPPACWRLRCGTAAAKMRQPDDNERVETYAVLVVSATRELSCKLGLASEQVDTLLPLHEGPVGTTGA